MPQARRSDRCGSRVQTASVERPGFSAREYVRSRKAPTDLSRRGGPASERECCGAGRKNSTRGLLGSLKLNEIQDSPRDGLFKRRQKLLIAENKNRTEEIARRTPMPVTFGSGSESSRTSCRRSSSPVCPAFCTLRACPGRNLRLWPRRRKTWQTPEKTTLWLGPKGGKCLEMIRPSLRRTLSLQERLLLVT